MDDKKHRKILMIALPLIALICFMLWSLQHAAMRQEVLSTNAVWNLESTDFSRDNIILIGEVEYIPNALLTPDEFETHASEIQIGDPSDTDNVSTSRITILLPDDGPWMIWFHSIDYSERIYINGRWMEDIGKPRLTRKDTTPGVKLCYYMVEAVDGKISIVQQSANFVHHDSGGHDGIVVGRPDTIKRELAQKQSYSAIVLGCFFTLFIVHLILYVLFKAYKANLYFALFCLTLFVRVAVSGVNLSALIFANVNWYAAFRTEYISVPILCLLLIWTVQQVFPKVLPKWFLYAITILSVGFAVTFLFLDTLLMSQSIIAYYMIAGAGAVFMAVLVALKVRRLRTEQVLMLLGMGVFLYLGIRDFFYYNKILLPPLQKSSTTDLGMLIFAFSQMMGMFYATMREEKEARAAERMALKQVDALEDAARKQAALRSSIPKDQRLERGTLLLNRQTGRAYLGGEDMNLTRTEFSMLSLFVQNENICLSKETIYEKVWEQAANNDLRAVWTHISTLKRKLDMDKNDAFRIVTKRGKGYIFTYTP